MRPRRPEPSGRGGRRSGRAGALTAALLLGVIAFFAWRGSSRPTETAGWSQVDAYEADARIAPLLGGCAFGAPFEADTSNLAEVLSSKLDAGALLEPQRRAKSELAGMGDAAAEPLMRLFQSASKDKWRGGVARNVLAVCALAESDWGVPIGVEALRSPREDLRGDAALVLHNHPRADLYEPLEAALGGFRLEMHVNRVLAGMAACDRVRFARSLPGWVARAERIGDYIESTVIDAAAPLVASVEDPEVAVELYDLVDATPELLLRHRTYLLAPAARYGHGDARQRLIDLLAHEQRMPRHHAAEALALAGLVDDTYVLAATALDAGERSQTLKRILEHDEDRAAERSEAQRADVVVWARAAMLDDEPIVREVALRGLLRRGDEEGRAALMTLLKGSVVEQGLGMRAMRDSLGEWPEVAEQARGVLAALYEVELAGARRGDVLTSTLQAMGAVPGLESGEFLLRAGDVVGENPIRGIAGFRWCVGQAFNAGPAARLALRDRLLVEADPTKRLDLISFVWQDRELESVDLLMSIVEDPSRDPHERLYAADRAVRMGHSERILPGLKRVYRSESDGVLRPGLHCLLWIWFGPPLG